VFRKLTIGLAVAILVLAITIGWQVGASEVANVELQDDMHDMTSKLGTRIGFSAPKSDDDYRNEIIHRAEQHGIQLQPEEVTVEHHGSGESETITLAANYSVAVKIWRFSFLLHFAPKSAKS
jgi:hypothetical protein